MAEIHIMKDFTHTPGARYRTDGPFSGQQFREELLEKHFSSKENNEIIRVYLDGPLGYATSFLEEAFGGIARKYGRDRCKKRFEFISSDNTLISEILTYIENVDEKK